MKQKLSMLLILTLLLSLFAGCTPADAPSTGDSSADASLSETDIMISETNTDASTDSESFQTSSEPVVVKTILTYEDIRNAVHGIVFGVAEDKYLEDLWMRPSFACCIPFVGGEWHFENIQVMAARTLDENGLSLKTIREIRFFPDSGYVLTEKEVEQLLLVIGIDTAIEKPVVEESVDENTKVVSTRCVYVLRTLNGTLSVEVCYSCYPHAVSGHRPALIGTPYCNALIVRPVK